MTARARCIGHERRLRGNDSGTCERVRERPLALADRLTDGIPSPQWQCG